MLDSPAVSGHVGDGIDAAYKEFPESAWAIRSTRKATSHPYDRERLHDGSIFLISAKMSYYPEAPY
jgi:hypothetical protein